MICGQADGVLVSQRASMPKSDRDALVHKAVENHFRSYAYADTEEVRLKLGEKFEASVWVFLERKKAQREEFESYFKKLSDEELTYFASESSRERGSQRPEELEALRKTASESIGAINDYFLTAIGFYQEYLPDYKMWALRDTFSEFELTWLSMGFEPNHPLMQAQRNSFNGHTNKIDPSVARLAKMREEIIVRSKTLATYGHGSASGPKALAWLNSIELDVPNGFRKMLEVSAARVDGNSPERKVNPEPEDQRADPRAVRSASRIIAAIAMDAYGWRPEDKRSPIPGEIETLCDTQGLGVTRETILKYLRMGAAQIGEIGREEK